jgi:hypothetical protein
MAKSPKLRMTRILSKSKASHDQYTVDVQCSVPACPNTGTTIMHEKDVDRIERGGRFSTVRNTHRCRCLKVRSDQLIPIRYLAVAPDRLLVDPVLGGK